MPASACAESEGRMRPMIDEQEFRKLADDALNALNRNLIALDRKSTRLNSSHLVISYAVFCLKKKNTMKSYISRKLPLETRTTDQIFVFRSSQKLIRFRLSFRTSCLSSTTTRKKANANTITHS